MMPRRHLLEPQTLTKEVEFARDRMQSLVFDLQKPLHLVYLISSRIRGHCLAYSVLGAPRPQARWWNLLGISAEERKIAGTRGRFAFSESLHLLSQLVRRVSRGETGLIEASIDY
jgi:hypothetical protein